MEGTRYYNGGGSRQRSTPCKVLSGRVCGSGSKNPCVSMPGKVLVRRRRLAWPGSRSVADLLAVLCLAVAVPVASAGTYKCCPHDCNCNWFGFNCDTCYHTRNCAGCPAGQYRSGCGGESGGSCVNCAGCPAGQYLSGCGGTSGGSCATCAAGKYKTTESSEACLTCISTCPTGKYRSGCSTTEGPGQCSDCLPGTYKDTSGTHACTGCDAGTNSTQVAATSDIVCEDCGVNTYSLTGSSICSDCPAHSSSPAASPAKSSCVCNPGYAGSFGAADNPCTACAVGKFSIEGISSGYASRSCALCPADSSSPVGSDGVDDCFCNAGYTGPNGVACTACAAGTYKQDTGNATCSMCPRNTNSSGLAATSANTCQPCGPGLMSAAGAAQCDFCPVSDRSSPAFNAGWCQAFGAMLKFKELTADTAMAGAGAVM